jgi:anti-sigma B factor antagonist
MPIEEESSPPDHLGEEPPPGAAAIEGASATGSTSAHAVTRSAAGGAADGKAQQLIDLAVGHPRPGVVVIQAVGEIDMLTTPLLQAEVDRQLAGDGLDAVLIDLREVSFLASAGLAALVDAHRRTAERGVRLRVIGASRAVVRPIRATGLDDLLDIHEETDTAT